MNMKLSLNERFDNYWLNAFSVSTLCNRFVARKTNIVYYAHIFSVNQIEHLRQHFVNLSYVKEHNAQILGAGALFKYCNILFGFHNIEFCGQNFA